MDDLRRYVGNTPDSFNLLIVEHGLHDLLSDLYDGEPGTSLPMVDVHVIQPRKSRYYGAFQLRSGSELVELCQMMSRSLAACSYHLGGKAAMVAEDGDTAAAMFAFDRKYARLIESAA